MTLNELKTDSRTIFYDNSDNAAKNWSKCWGLGWWFDLWRYKEYKLGALMYRTGQVVFRHRKESLTKYYINENETSKKEFMECLSLLSYQPKEFKQNLSKNNTPKAVQLSLFD